jgi:transposase InsO family protein
MYPVIQEAQAVLSLPRLCQVVNLPRSWYYRHQNRSNNKPEDPLTAQVRQICEEDSSAGYRRVTQELHRRGVRVNHKRILALMRKENLLVRPKRRFVRTTDSKHIYPIYHNLARTMTLTAPNQLWVADITYIHLVQGTVYLAVILDAFSRRAIGWALSSHIDHFLSLEALQMALATRDINPGLVHHSDQGSQYACYEYVELLKSKNITISMSRKGNPYDNAKAESFIKTLKVEEVYINEYYTISEARTNIDRFIDLVYNRKRLHSALGYRPPLEFEVDFLNLNRSTLTLEKTVSA